VARAENRLYYCYYRNQDPSPSESRRSGNTVLVANDWLQLNEALTVARSKTDVSPRTRAFKVLTREVM